MACKYYATSSKGRMHPNITFEKKLTAALIATTLLTIVLSLLTWRVVVDADSAARWVRHTSRVIDDIATTREATIQIESMTRGYMIYGDLSQLAERENVAKRRTEAIAQIEKDTKDNPFQQARIPVLRKAALERRALSDQLIALRDTEGFEAARNFGRGPMAAQTKNAYLTVLDEMDDEERRLLKQRDADQIQTRANAVRIGILTALVMLALLISAYMMINRHSRSIIQARRDLEEANLKLKEAKETAEHANAAKDTFLATMSHEIRTPMSGLLGMLELLALSRLNSEQAETLAVARDSGHALGRIIDDILDHAKIEAGKLSIAPEPVSLVQLLQRNVNTYFAVASRKGLTLRQMVDPRISPALMADPLRLLQVLGNLVSNAIKFTQEGYVEVRAELVSRGAGVETVRLSVKDTGIGMSPEAQTRIFQPFEQAGADTERLYGGTGLGLAISRRLAQMMGADIVIDSALGAGTTMGITLVLPVTDDMPIERFTATSVRPLWQDTAADNATSLPTSPASAAATEAPGNPAQGPFVLAVDDNPTNRLLIARQLSTLGMRVQTASHGQEALAMWQTGDFALVITDCNMPEMDGYALTRALRQHEAAHARPRTPVLGWTANALANTLSACKDAGMDAVLTKPSELGQLRALLLTWLPKLSPVTKPAAKPDLAITPVLDLILLKEVSDNDPVALRELVQTVRNGLSTQIPELSKVLEGDDLESIQQEAHKMKGSAGMIGAQTLIALCTRMEAAADSSDLSELPILREQFAMEAQRVMEAFKALG
jgi:signal transduction histidine kinase/HPt (histidine-containing phosphotransfer) domain-containing protein/ActR/RegA family two-component response regulator